MAHSKVGVVIPVLSQFQMATDCVSSLKSKYDIETFIIPNYRDPRPSLSDSWNEGISAAAKKWCDYVLIVNDDTVLAPWTIDHLVDFMRARGSNGMQDWALITGKDVRHSVFSAHHMLTMEAPEFKPREVQQNPDFACFMLMPELIEDIGWFDTNFKPAYFEDNDYNMRITTAGFKSGFLHSAWFYHYGSQTQNNTGNESVVTPPLFEANRSYYIDKWGGAPGQEKFTMPFNREPVAPPVIDEPIEIIGEE